MGFINYEIYRVKLDGLLRRIIKVKFFPENENIFYNKVYIYEKVFLSAICAKKSKMTAIRKTKDSATIWKTIDGMQIILWQRKCPLQSVNSVKVCITLRFYI